MHKGQVLKNLIKKSSYTQKKVAQEIGVEERYFGVLLKDSNVKDELIQRVCDFLEVDVEKHFSTEEDDKNYMAKYIDAMEKLTQTQNELLRCKAELMNSKIELQDYKHKFGKLNG